ncbi:hypothetical protein M427DRAFT_505616, partial [Gonapodya prolifera JEL478]
QFAGDTSVHEACREIRERLGDFTGGQDHGLYHPDTRQWLTPNRVLDYYNLKSGDVLEYKKKTRPLKVRLVDDTTKTVLIDESASVKQLVEYICDKIGIANPDEYSLQCDVKSTSSKKSNETLSRRDKRGKGSLEDLSEEGRWLLPEKCLAEQGVADTDAVMLKKKFFFSDQNVDRNDPVQLNLIYNQSKEAILQGKYPCNPDEAIQFAALQAQVQFGNYEPEKHKVGFLKMKEFLPDEYQKERTFDKRIVAEHQKLHGMSELNAKFRYVQLCRSLKTYGFTFFVVKEKLAKKNKIVPMLLGVTKESVVRLDVETKEVIKSWPISQLRRWAASPNSLTLDFGDYADAYYSVQTNEGEAISSLIGGYIDIILKKRKDAERSVEIETEEMPITEEYMRPARANIINIHQGSSLKTADQGIVPVQANISAAAMATMQAGKVAANYLAFESTGNTATLAEVHGAQQACLQTITNGFAVVQSAAVDLTLPTQLPPLGDDIESQQWIQQTVDVNGENIAALISAHLAAAASVINHTGLDSAHIDYDSLAISVATLASNLPQITHAMKIVSALSSNADEGQLLMDGAHQLVKATQDFLEATQLGVSGDGNRIELYQTAQKLGAVSVTVLSQLRVLDIDEESQASLRNAAKAIAGATGSLVAAAKLAASASANALQGDIILQEARKCANSAAMLVAGTNLIAPVVGNTVALEQIVDATSFLRESVAMLMENAQDTGQGPISNLISAASGVEFAVSSLLQEAHSGGKFSKQTTLEKEFNTFIDVVQGMREQIGNSEMLVQKAREITACSTSLVALLKADGTESLDETEQQHLVQATKVLADATATMILIAKDCVRLPADIGRQQALRDALDVMQTCATSAVARKLKDSAFDRLAKASRNAVASVTQLTMAAEGAAISNRNQTSQLQLNQVTKIISEMSPSIISAVRANRRDPTDSTLQVDLIAKAKSIVAPASNLIAAAKTAATTTGDGSIQTQLVSCAKQTMNDLKALKMTLDLAEVAVKGSEITDAISTINEVRKYFLSGDLPPLPTAIDSRLAEKTLIEITKMLAKDCELLLSSITQVSFADIKEFVCDLNLALQSPIQVTAGLLSNDERIGVFKGAAAVANAAEIMLRLFQEASGNAVIDQDLMQRAATDLNDNLQSLLTLMPTPRQLENIQADIKSLSVSDNNTIETGGLTNKEVRAKVSSSAALLIQGANALVTAGGNNDLQEITRATKDFGPQFQVLVDAVKLTSLLSNDADTSSLLDSMIKDLVKTTSDLLSAARVTVISPSPSQDHRGDLVTAGQAVAEAIGALLSATSAAGPAISACNSCLSNIATATSRLANIDEVPSVIVTFSQISGAIKVSTKQSASAISSILKLTSENDEEALSLAIAEFGQSLLQMTDATVKMAYLVGTMDPLSVAGQSPKIDISRFMAYMKSIKTATDALAHDSPHQASILNAAAVIAKNTSAACNACKEISQNPQLSGIAQGEFTQYAKTIAAVTSGLVPKMKRYALSLDKQSQLDCGSALEPLQEVIESLCSYVKQPEFSGRAPKLSIAGRAAQKPFIENATKALTSATDYVNTIQYSLENEGVPERSALIAKGRVVGDSIRAISQIISTGVPGQKECDEAIHLVTNSLADIDALLVELEASSTDIYQGKQLDQCSKKCKTISDAGKVMSSLCEVLVKTAKSNAVELGQSASQVPQNFCKIASLTMDLASLMKNDKSYKQILEALKDLAEQLTSLLNVCKQAAGNAEYYDAHDQLDSDLIMLQEGVRKFINTLDVENLNASPEFAAAIDQIETQLPGISEHVPVDSPYQQYSAEVERIGSQYLEIVRNMVKLRNGNDFAAIASRIGETFSEIIFAVRAARTSADDSETKQKLEMSSLELANTSIKALETLRIASKDAETFAATKTKLSIAARELSSATKKLMQIAHDGAKGANICHDIVCKINEHLSDLEATVMFANAGQLDATEENDSFAKHRDELLAAAKSLSDTVKDFPNALDGSQDALIQNVQSASNALDDILCVVKKAATSVSSGERDLQLKLLSAAQDVASNLASLTSAVSVSYGKGEESTERKEVDSCLKHQVASLMELIKVTKVIGETSSKGEAKLAKIREDIEGAINEYDSKINTEERALPVEVVENANQFAKAAAYLVSVVSSGQQDNFYAATGKFGKELCSLIKSAKAAVSGAPNGIQIEMSQNVKQVAKNGIDLVEKVAKVLVTPTMKTKNELNGVAKSIVSSVNSLVNAASQLVPEGYVDPNDPNVIAEHELLIAASAIEAAAKKLSSYQPVAATSSEIVDVDNMSFNDVILQAAKAIAAATSALVRSATSAQREIMASVNGKMAKGKMYHSDGTWSEGLVSAAKNVAAHVADLCEVASVSHIEDNKREKALAAAKGVNAATAQLLSAAQVRTDATSSTQVRLKAAGKGVTNATEQLVKAVEESLLFVDKVDTTALKAKDNSTGTRVAEFEAQASIIKMEAELTKARQRLLNIRKGKYGGAK